MAAEILIRTFWTLIISSIAIVLFVLYNRVLLSRSKRRYRLLENYHLGTPAILYFTTPTCVPCKSVQRPALQQIKHQMGPHLQVIEVDAAARPDLAADWGVLSVPTTFLLDSKGRPRHVNHGVTRAEKLQQQLQSYFN
jgi:thioredoxin-like negative regulator of GroEL